MTAAHKNRTLIAVAVAVIVVGAIVALATWHSGHGNSSSAHSGHQAVGVMAIAANYLGVSDAQLRSELRSGRSLAEVADATSGKSSAGLIDAVVQSRAAAITTRESAGHISTSEANARLAELRAAAAARVERIPVTLLAGANLLTAADYLSLTPAEVRTRQLTGQSLAQIADGTSGKSAAGLIAALVHGRTIAIGKLEKAGRLTSAEASARIATLPRRVTSAVEHQPRARPPVPAG